MNSAPVKGSFVGADLSFAVAVLMVLLLFVADGVTSC
jgi:hypothetical protein